VLIRKLHAQGVSIIAAIHDLALITGTFSSVLLISPHERLRLGLPGDVLQPAVLERAFQCPVLNPKFEFGDYTRKEFAL
jgi:iron complex transport system ATP-binding protein